MGLSSTTDSDGVNSGDKLVTIKVLDLKGAEYRWRPSVSVWTSRRRQTIGWSEAAAGHQGCGQCGQRGERMP
jgi:hypothetical protein